MAHGRPPGPPHKKRSIAIDLRVSPAEHRCLMAAMKAESPADTVLAGWLYRTVMKHARRVPGLYFCEGCSDPLPTNRKLCDECVVFRRSRERAQRQPEQPIEGGIWAPVIDD